MQAQYIFTSVARISDLEDGDFRIGQLARNQWARGDYIAGTVTGPPSPLYRVELTSGRIIEVLEGMHLVGAFGTRAATLEATGDWTAIGDDRTFDALTGAGLFGKTQSIAPSLPRLISMRYEGHVLREGKKVTMQQFVGPSRQAIFSIPVVLVIGTSMSAGKTTAGRLIVHMLKQAGLNVAGAKFTGAGRYRDVLSFRDAGADTIIDFVDAGLPSTVVPAAEFAQAMEFMLNRIAGSDVDIVVAEAGASPLEPYNGETVLHMLKDHLCCTVLCASDPYAVLGVREAFQLTPDIVTGPTANTQAGIELVHKLTGLTALNIMDPMALPQLRETLSRRLSAAGLELQFPTDAS